jgi:hypothetical protein
MGPGVSRCITHSITVVYIHHIFMMSPQFGHEFGPSLAPLTRPVHAVTACHGLSRPVTAKRTVCLLYSIRMGRVHDHTATVTAVSRAEY